jgi:hypothetical protein
VYGFAKSQRANIHDDEEEHSSRKPQSSSWR